MTGRLAGPTDPFEGRAARRRAARLRAEGLLAICLAVAACSLTAIAWAVALAPLIGLGLR